MQATRSSSIGQRISNYLYLHPRSLLILLLAVPVLWLGIVYLGSLLMLLIQSFFRLDDFTGQVVRQFSLASYSQLLSRANPDIFMRTVGVAAAVTLGAILLAFPLAYFMSFYASRRIKALLYLSIMLPLWSSYLVRVYSWKLILAKRQVSSSTPTSSHRSRKPSSQQWGWRHEQLHRQAEAGPREEATQ